MKESFRGGTVIAIVSVALASHALAPSTRAGLTQFLTENATYRYVNATAATSVSSVPDEWFAVNFDDSNWFTGGAPFANQSGTISDLSNASGPQTPDTAAVPYVTYWAANYDPYLRATFVLPEKANLTLWLAVDNGVNSIYLNGVLATAPVNMEGPAYRWEHVFDIPASYTFAGVNTLALQLEDHGGWTGFALIITADDDKQNPIFTSNPPPPPAVPEPASILLAAAGLVGLLGVSKRNVARATS